MKRALLIIDVQNDFLPGGSLAVKDGNQIISVINTLQKLPFDLIIATKDWHPLDHASFDTWPAHCIQTTQGAEFPPPLNTKKINKIILKGTDKNIDSYSAFFDNDHTSNTDLDEYLKENFILELFLTGLATEYCVKYTALDALNLGYTVYLIKDACKAILDELSPLKEISNQGAKIITSQEVTNLIH